MSHSVRLNNKVILITRPQHQLTELQTLLASEGAQVVALPSIEICPLKHSQPLDNIFTQLNAYNLIIFISANAVRQASVYLNELGIAADKLSADIAVIGRSTLMVAKEHGFKVSIEPEQGSNSSALLALPALQAQAIGNKQVLIIRGQGGLEQLADTLKARGARVEYAEVYQRRIPQQDAVPDRIELSRNWAQTGINVITVASNQALENLCSMLQAPGRQLMLSADLIVPSQRCYELAQKLGFKKIHMAASAHDQHMFEAALQLNE